MCNGEHLIGLSCQVDTKADKCSNAAKHQPEMITCRGLHHIALINLLWISRGLLITMMHLSPNSSLTLAGGDIWYIRPNHVWTLFHYLSTLPGLMQWVAVSRVSVM